MIHDTAVLTKYTYRGDTAALIGCQDETHYAEQAGRAADQITGRIVH